MPSVLITGASRGLGLEFAKQYASAGWRLWACARRPSAALAGLAGIHADVTLLQLDVTAHDEIDAAAAGLRSEAIDVLLNNAGVIGRHDFGEGALDEQRFGHSDYVEWERAWRTNAVAPMKMAEAFVEQVARSGQKKIVTLTSMVGSNGLNTSGGLYGYRSSKAAVNAIMKSMSIDLAPRGILAVAIHPGWARTAMGGSRAPLEVADAAAAVRRVIDGLGPAQLGQVLAHDGTVLPY